jgi:hypothetical protein
LTAWNDRPLPDLTAPQAAICALWDDLYPPASGASVRTGMIGTAPQRRFVITWQGVPHVATTDAPQSVQVVLHEDSGDIVIAYLDVNDDDPAWGSGNSASIGLTDPHGAAACAWSWEGDQPVANKTAIHFSRPTTRAVTIAVTDDGSSVAIETILDDAPHIAPEPVGDADRYEYLLPTVDHTIDLSPAPTNVADASTR